MDALLQLSLFKQTNDEKMRYFTSQIESNHSRCKTDDFRVTGYVVTQRDINYWWLADVSTAVIDEVVWRCQTEFSSQVRKAEMWKWWVLGFACATYDTMRYGWKLPFLFYAAKNITNSSLPSKQLTNNSQSSQRHIIDDFHVHTSLDRLPWGNRCLSLWFPS